MRRTLIAFICLLIGATMEVEATCGNDRSLQNDVYAPKSALIQFLGRYQTKMPSETLCAIYCSQLQLTAYWYDPDTQWCLANWIAKESYTDYIPGSNASSKIMVNTRLAGSMNNYVLGCIDNTNVLFSVFGTSSYFEMEPKLRGMVNPLPLASPSYVSPMGGVGNAVFKGTSFNWQTHTFLICGGKQDSLGLSNSSDCYYLQTKYSNPVYPPWNGPISMSQGRTNANIAALGKKFYIFGGNVYDIMNDYVDVLDPITSEMTILKNTDGIPVKFPELTNIPLSCSIGLEDANSILVIGGRPGSGGTDAVYSLNVEDRTLTKLPSLNFGRCLHVCERVTRGSLDYVVVAGGKNAYGVFTDTVEFYDLKKISATWTIGSMTLPSEVYPSFRGAAISWFDSTGCEAMFLSVSTSKMTYCTGNFSWTSSSKLTINAYVVKMDAGPFWSI